MGLLESCVYREDNKRENALIKITPTIHFQTSTLKLNNLPSNVDSSSFCDSIAVGVRTIGVSCAPFAKNSIPTEELPMEEDQGAPCEIGPLKHAELEEPEELELEEIISSTFFEDIEDSFSFVPE